MPEMCKKQYHRFSSDLLDEHDKWFHKMQIDEGPDNYLEWYNAWMDIGLCKLGDLSDALIADA